MEQSKVGSFLRGGAKIVRLMEVNAIIRDRLGGNIRNGLVAVGVGLLAALLVGCPSASAGSGGGNSDGGGSGGGGNGGGATTTYDIGDRGPAGGLIFFDDEDNGSDDYGFRYLEAAPASTEWNDIEWGDDETDINGDNSTVAPELDGVGDGQANTTAIVNELGNNGGTDYVAKLADELEHNGYSDWFLPSKDELDLMYHNLAQTGIGGFASDYYWSSSEDDAEGAWIQYFGDGNQYYYLKYGINRVRAVRAF